MQYHDFDILAPALLQQTVNEAEMLGSAVWLWMQSKEHRNYPLHVLATMLLPAIKTGQFILAVEKGKPVFYLSWAQFSEEAEQRYVTNPLYTIPEADWQSGGRIWILDWIAPGGNTWEMRNLTRLLFKNNCVRTLYHRGNVRGLRVIEFRGADVPPETAKAWFARHPVKRDAQPN